MRRSSFLLALATLLGAGLTFSAAQQPSAGGAFLPLESYVIGSGSTWTWLNASPWVLEGTTVDGNETTFIVTDPTADRNITIPNLTGTMLVATSALRFAAGAVGASGSNPFSVTTGLTTLSSCTVTQRHSTLTNADNATGFFTVLLTASAGRLDIYRWRTTGSEATDARDLVWQCVGTA